MNRNKFVIISIFIAVFLFGITGGIYFKYKYDSLDIIRELETIELNDIDNLMIVAHPDDETLWGSSELIAEKYLVVCITCGPNPTRAKEFKKVLGKTEDKFIMLGYPDKTKGERDDWRRDREKIIADLADIIEYKHWNKILTHNPVGEYGHQHHIMTSDFVTELVKDKINLFYFGHYYSKKNIEEVRETLPRLEDELLNYKINELISEYKSQTFLEEKFSQMYPYETVIAYQDWEG